MHDVVGSPLDDVLVELLGGLDRVPHGEPIVEGPDGKCAHLERDAKSRVDAAMLNPGQHFERPLYWRMNHRHQRALRMGDWKYLKVDDNEYLFNITSDACERANLVHKHPEKLRSMRQAWLAWESTVPAIPDDAVVSLGYSVKDMPQR